MPGAKKNYCMKRDKDSVYFWAIIIVFSALRVVKAILEPITYDEAFSFLHYACKSIAVIFSDYTFPNNHILNSLLMKLTTNIFGNSELILRLPSVIGGIFSAIIIYKLSIMLIPRKIMRFFFLLLVLSNPFLIKFQYEARGYSLGMGFCFLALYYLYKFFAGEYDSATKRKLAGVFLLVTSCFVLALGAVPTYINSFMAIWIAFFVVNFFGWSGGRPRLAIKKFTQAFFFIIIPTAILTKIFYLQISVDPSKIHIGLSLPRVLREYINFIFLYLRYPPEARPWVTVAYLLSAVTLIGLFYNIVTGRKRKLVLYVIFLSVVGLICFEYLALGIRAPYSRAFIFTIPLLYFFIIDFSEMIGRIKIKGRYYLHYLCLLLPAALIAANVLNIHFASYYQVEDDLALKQIMLLFEREGINRTEFTTLWDLDPQTQYYNQRLGLRLKVKRRDPSDYRIVKAPRKHREKDVLYSGYGFQLLKMNNLVAEFAEPFIIEDESVYNISFSLTGKFVWEEIIREIFPELDSWQADSNNVDYQLTAGPVDLVVAALQFDGGKDEDEFLRIAKELDIDLRKYRHLRMSYKVTDPEIQTVELVALLDLDNDKQDDVILKTQASPNMINYAEWNWDIYGHARDKFPELNIEQCRLLKLEIYFHKQWHTDCSGKKQGRYVFWIRDLHFFEEIDQMLFAAGKSQVRLEGEVENINLKDNVFERSITTDKLDVTVVPGLCLAVSFTEQITLGQQINLVLELLDDTGKQRSLLLDTVNFDQFLEPVVYDLTKIIPAESIKITKIKVTTRKDLSLDRNINLDGNVAGFTFFSQKTISPPDLKFCFLLDGKPLACEKEVEVNKGGNAVTYNFNGESELGKGEHLLTYTCLDNIEVVPGEIYINEK